MSSVATEEGIASCGRPRSVTRATAMRINGFLFTLPAILLVGVVTLLPLFQAFYYSFTNWNGAQATWAGLANYANVVADPELRRSLINNLLLFASVPFGLVPPFVVAYLLHKNIRGNKLFRALIFAPTALSWVVIGMVGRVFFSYQGPFNSLLGLIGLGGVAPNWLAESNFALAAVILTFNSAIFGINTIIFLTGLSTLDLSTIEAARLDGASGRQVLWYVIVPAMRGFIEFVLIITIVTSFTGLFGMIYVMTGGGPGSSTMTLDFAVWRRAFASGAFGAGAAVGITLMIVTLAAIGLVRLVMRRWSDA